MRVLIIPVTDIPRENGDDQFQVAIVELTEELLAKLALSDSRCKAYKNMDDSFHLITYASMACQFTSKANLTEMLRTQPDSNGRDDLLKILEEHDFEFSQYYILETNMFSSTDTDVYGDFPTLQVGTEGFYFESCDDYCNYTTNFVGYSALTEEPYYVV